MYIHEYYKIEASNTHRFYYYYNRIIAFILRKGKGRAVSGDNMRDNGRE